MKSQENLINPEDIQELEEGEKQVPTRGLIITFFALISTFAVYLLWPESANQYIGLVWIFSLVPIFLLSYYKGWKGTAIAAILTMVAFASAEFISLFFLEDKVDWWLYAVVVVLLFAISLFVGWLSNKLIQERKKAMKMAFMDSLTGLASRRALDFFLKKEVAASRRGQKLSIVLFDLDDFKQFNDTYGHSSGDEVLQRVGEVFQNISRDADVIGRYGGEEFMSILPDTGEKGAETFAKRVCSQIEKLDLPYSDCPTISAGVSSWSEQMSDGEELLDQADVALYRAKSEGGNRVRKWSEIVKNEVPDQSYMIN